MVQLHRSKVRFDDADARIVLVSMGSVEETAAFKRKFDLSFPMVSDPDRELYNIFQIGFMSISSILTPKMAMRTVSTLARGHGVGIPQGDIRQLSAVFIIETNGIISYAQYAKDSADHPSPEQILDQLTKY